MLVNLQQYSAYNNQFRFCMNNSTPTAIAVILSLFPLKFSVEVDKLSSIYFYKHDFINNDL